MGFVTVLPLTVSDSFVLKNLLILSTSSPLMMLFHFLIPLPLFLTWYRAWIEDEDLSCPLGSDKRPLSFSLPRVSIPVFRLTSSLHTVC